MEKTRLDPNHCAIAPPKTEPTGRLVAAVILSVALALPNISFGIINYLNVKE